MGEVYLGNPNLKKANTQIEFTKENVLEFLKCKDDPVYFARKYIKIVSLDQYRIASKSLKIKAETINVSKHNES